MRRRCLVALLCAALVLSGCAGRATPEPVTIAFACRDYQREQYQALAAEFQQQHPTVSVRLISYDEATGNDPGVATSDDVAKVAAVADTFSGTSFDVDLASSRAALLDLTDLAQNDDTFERDDFYAGILSQVERGGRLYGLPYSANLALVFYDPAVLAEVGAIPPTVGWTWDDLLAAATLATGTGSDGATRFGFIDRSFTDTLTALAHGMAGGLTEAREDGDVLHLAEPAVAEALRWYLALYEEHGVMPAAPSQDDRQALDDLVYGGRAAMWTGQSFELDTFATLRDAAIAPLPGGATPAWSQVYFVSAGTAHPEAAWQWIEFLSRRRVGVLAGAVPTRGAQVGADYWAGLGEERAAVLQYCLDHPLVYPRTVGTALGRALEAALAGQPVETALAEAEAKAAETLAEVAEVTPAAVVATPAPTAGEAAIVYAAQPGASLSAVRDLAERFNAAHPDVQVDVQPGGSGSLANSAAAADCFADYSWLLESDDTSSLVAIDPFVEEGGYDLAPYGKQLLAVLTRDGRLWGLPLQTDYRFAYYNRDLLDSLGIATPAAGWQPTDLVATALAATDLAADPPVYGFLPRDGAYGDLPAYLSSLGGSLVGPDGGLTLDDPSVVEALSLWVELAAAMPPMALEYDNAFGWEVRGSGGHPTLVADGHVAIWLDDYINHSVAEPLDFAVGVTTMPAAGVAMTGTGMTVLYISADSDRPDACWQWLTFLAAQPEAVTLLPAREDVARSDVWLAQVDADMAAAWASVVSGQANADGTGEILSSGVALYWLKEAVHEALDGRAPEEALAEAQEHTVAFQTCLTGLTETSESAIESCALQADPDVVVR